MTLEVCVDSIATAEIAAAAGADRIELCSVLSVGGVTPTASLIRHVVRAVSVPVIVLVRCKPGAFYYSSAEKLLMLDEIREAIEAGASGVAVGSLIRSNSSSGDAIDLDADFLSALTASAPGDCELVMHRAFDEVSDHAASLETLIQLGFTRVLTSGGRPTAIEGSDRLGALHRQAAERITILPGGGVRGKNAAELLKRTGCRELHGSFRIGIGDSLPDAGEIVAAQAALSDARPRAI
ncbi:MAG: copper homeostasis protein CutC [Pirellulales bacterium]